VARSAHALTSQAALLGFPELAELCTLLEQACVGGSDFSVSLEAVRRAARDARKVIVGMKPAVLA
jgi:HPt (histidine-containing phosphotransfer) domain-containing protein